MRTYNYHPFWFALLGVTVLLHALMIVAIDSRVDDLQSRLDVIEERIDAE